MTDQNDQGKYERLVQPHHIERSPCNECGHPYQMHTQLGNCVQRTTQRYGALAACPCNQYEPEFYDTEPGPNRPAQVNRPQDPPRPGVGDIQKAVMEDLEKRREFGISKYGTPLQAFNGRDALMDAYQEALDLVVYLRQVIEERDYPLQPPETANEANEPESSVIHILTLHNFAIEEKPYSTCSCNWTSGPQMTEGQAREEWLKHVGRL